jgi:hypothetical protein
MPLRPGRVVEKNRPNVRDTAIWQNVHGLEIPWPNVERRDVTTGEPPRHTCSGTLMMMQCRGGFASGLSTGTSKDYPRRCSCKSFRATFLRRGSLFASIQQSCASHRDVGFFVHQNANHCFFVLPSTMLFKALVQLALPCPIQKCETIGTPDEEHCNRRQAWPRRMYLRTTRKEGRASSFKPQGFKRYYSYFFFLLLFSVVVSSMYTRSNRYVM